jgi:hypothetical protein
VREIRICLFFNINLFGVSSLPLITARFETLAVVFLKIFSPQMNANKRKLTYFLNKIAGARDFCDTLPCGTKGGDMQFIKAKSLIIISTILR